VKWAVAIAALAAGCLPAGDAPARGAVEITVVGSEAVARGIDASGSTDSWSVVFDRALVLIAYFSFEKSTMIEGGFHGEACVGHGRTFASVFSLKSSATIRLRGFEAGPCN